MPNPLPRPRRRRKIKLSHQARRLLPRRHFRSLPSPSASWPTTRGSRIRQSKRILASTGRPPHNKTRALCCVAVRRRDVLFPTSAVDATEPPNRSSHYPTTKLSPPIERIGHLQPTAPALATGPDTTPPHATWRQRPAIRRISGSGAAAPSPVRWRREGRAREQAAEVTIRCFGRPTPMAVQRPQKN